MKDENLTLLLENPAINLMISLLQEEVNKLTLLLKEGKISDGTSENLMAHYHFYVGKIEGLEYPAKFIEDLIKRLTKKNNQKEDDSDELFIG